LVWEVQSITLAHCIILQDKLKSLVLIYRGSTELLELPLNCMLTPCIMHTNWLQVDAHLKKEWFSRSWSMGMLATFQIPLVIIFLWWLMCLVFLYRCRVPNPIHYKLWRKGKSQEPLDLKVNAIYTPGAAIPGPSTAYTTSFWTNLRKHTAFYHGLRTVLLRDSCIQTRLASWP